MANEKSIGQFYLEIVETDFAFETHCEIMLITMMPIWSGAFPEKINPGMYIVRSDIFPGTYRGDAGGSISESCYWARLSNLRGETDGIIASENATGEFLNQVQSSDAALLTTCELEWVGE